MASRRRLLIDFPAEILSKESYMNKSELIDAVADKAAAAAEEAKK